jgi:tryptophan synthase alpha chain
MLFASYEKQKAFSRPWRAPTRWPRNESQAMSRIDRAFKRVKSEGRSALIPFVMAGDQDLEVTADLVLKMAECGADIIELGVPFSDPLLDGPTLQAASHRALQKGIGLKEVLHVAKSLREMDTPLVIMTYFDPVFRYGLKSFAKECRESGIAGVIIPDLPPEETGSWIVEARTFELDTIFLVSPTSSPERIRWVSRVSRGFIYHVSITGVTGARKELADGLKRDVLRVKENSNKPVAVGFGISTPEQAREVSRFADGVIVGSAMVKIIEENLGRSDLVSKIGDFVSCLGEALKP